MALLSPGVEVKELDASGIAPTASNSIAVFCGDFTKGSSQDYKLISTVDELIYYYGKPTQENYNQWFQAYNFLHYGDKLYIARATDPDTHRNSVAYCTTEAMVNPIETEYISNPQNLEAIFDSLEIEDSAIKLKFFGRNPGTWMNDTKICICTTQDFNQDTPSLAFEGIPLDPLFEYVPDDTENEFGIIVQHKGEIVETWTVSSNPEARDHNNKTMYVQDLINLRSDYIYVKENTANTEPVPSFCFESNGTAGSVIEFTDGVDAEITNATLAQAYDLFSNAEFLDVDIIIGNELDGGISAANLAIHREDCIAFIGAEYDDCVNISTANAINKLIAWRQTGAMNINSSYVSVAGNYKYMYDRYNDTNRWVNIAGDVSGLRALTTTTRDSWWASGGLERGQIRHCVKLGINPSRPQRDLLYKNSINPIVSFPGQGVVVWGQKTLLSKPSSFDRVNVRGLFNEVERSLRKMARFKIMEFNDPYTRNRIVSMIKPYLSTVKAGRGITDYLVICDETNNTPDIISRNELIVDIYIKPVYVAEFITLRFTNAGTNSFSEIIGGI